MIEIFVLVLLAWIIKWGLIIFGAYIALRILIAIFTGIFNSVKDSSNRNGESTTVEYKPSTTPKKDSFNIDMDYAVPPKTKDPSYTSTSLTTSTYNAKYEQNDFDEYDNLYEGNKLEELDHTRKEDIPVGGPYICPECFEPYDGLYCEACGHSNDEHGYEEVRDADKLNESIVAAAMFVDED